jgi:iron(III) transport system substrate-binding protein
MQDFSPVFTHPRRPAMAAWLYEIVILMLLVPAAGVASFAATTSPALLKAKTDSETRGYIFAASHSEIVERARAEGKLRALSSLSPNAFKVLADAFKRKYPFLDVYLEEISGAEGAQRFLLELKANRASDWDVMNISEDFYSEYDGYKKRFDLLGMSEHRIVQIPAEMIDPKRRDAMVQSSVFSVVAYNRNLIPAEKVPGKWEDFFNPDYNFKGRRLLVDIRGGAKDLVAMVQAWGLDRVLDYARKLASLEPVWANGYTRALASVSSGEHAVGHMINWHTVIRAQSKDASRSLAYKIVEPVPVRLINTGAVTKSALHPYAGLLWLEFLASLEGQAIIDKHEPLKSNLYVPGSEVAKSLHGKKASVTSLNVMDNSTKWLENVIAAMGFPKAELRQ